MSVTNPPPAPCFIYDRENTFANRDQIDLTPTLSRLQT